MAQKTYILSRCTIEALEQEMQTLLAKSRAKSALIVDRSGNVFCSAGAFSSTNPQDLGVMATATFMALNKMLDIANSYELSVRFHTPRTENIFFAAVDERLIIVVLYDSSTTGRRVRQASREFVLGARQMLSVKPNIARELKPLPPIAEDLDKLLRGDAQSK